MDALGWRLKFLEPERPWAGWKPPDADRPLLVMGKPENGEPAMPGNGQMVALLAPSRTAVDHCLRCRHRGGLPIGRPTGIAAAISSVVLWRLFSATGRPQDLRPLSHAKAVARGPTALTSSSG